MKYTNVRKTENAICKPKAIYQIFDNVYHCFYWCMYAVPYIQEAMVGRFMSLYLYVRMSYSESNISHSELNKIYFVR